MGNLDPRRDIEIEVLASSIARRLASPARYASPPLGVDIDLLASAIAHRLASPVQYAPRIFASAIAYRLSSPAHAALSRSLPELAFANLDFEALASRVVSRVSGAQAIAGSPEKILDALASTIAGRLTERVIAVPPAEFERFASKAASSIGRRLAPDAQHDTKLPSDSIDASQALKTEDQRARKGEKK